MAPPRGARNESRARWILTGVVIGAVVGVVATAWMVAWGTFFVDEHTTSALVLGVVVGAGGWFLLTYDHGRRQEVIDETRRVLARLTALLERTDNQD